VDVSLYAVVVDKPLLPAGFIDLGAPDSTLKGWGSDANDANPIADLTWNTFKAAKYLIIKATLKNPDGFGGFEIAIQSDADSWAFHKWESGNWTGAPSGAAANDTIYIVLDLPSYTEAWTAVTGSIGTKGKIFLNYISDSTTGGFPEGGAHIEILNGYIATVNMTMPTTGATAFGTGKSCDGWSVKALPPEMVVP
jgi:hypothetical protein